MAEEWRSVPTRGVIAVGDGRGGRTEVGDIGRGEAEVTWIGAVREAGLIGGGLKEVGLAGGEICCVSPPRASLPTSPASVCFASSSLSCDLRWYEEENKFGDKRTAETRRAPATSFGSILDCVLDAVRRSALIAGLDEAIRRLLVVAFIRFFPCCCVGQEICHDTEKHPGADLEQGFGTRTAGTNLIFYIFGPPFGDHNIFESSGSWSMEVHSGEGEGGRDGDHTWQISWWIVDVK